MFSSTGKFDPKAMSNFYDNIQPGPVVPSNTVRRGKSSILKHEKGATDDFCKTIKRKRNYLLMHNKSKM